MQEPPLRTYLVYAVVISAVVIAAVVLFQRYSPSEQKRAEASRFMRELSFINYTFKKGEYEMYITTIARSSISELTVNEVVEDRFGGVTLEKGEILRVAGNATGDVTLRIAYATTGMEHTAYAVILEEK